MTQQQQPIDGDADTSSVDWLLFAKYVEARFID